MRKWILIFVTMIYLGSVTEVHEMLKVANLVAHYLEHLQQDKNLSFADFLVLHYGEHSTHGEAAEHQNQLPFKSHHVPFAGFIFFVPNQTEIRVTESLDRVDEFSPRAFYRSMAASARVSSIWQPPRHNA